MTVTVTRRGGIMAMPPLVRTTEDAALDPAARAALDALAARPPGAPARRPDAFVYRFEWTAADGTGHTAALTSGDIPAPLRTLLP
jgi:hypothetical protein